MAIVIACPRAGCGQKLRIAEQCLGMQMLCPFCRRVFNTHAEGPILDEEEPPLPTRRHPARDETEDEAEKPRRRPPVEEEPEEPEELKEVEEEVPPQLTGRPATDDAQEEPSRAAEEEEQEEEPPRKRRPKRKRPPVDVPAPDMEAGWRKVARGMFLCILSMWLWISEFVILVVGLVAIGGIGAALVTSGSAGLGTLAGLGAGLLAVFALINLAQVVGNGLQLVGVYFCAAVPSEEGSLQNTAVFTFALSASAALVSLAGQVFVLITSGWQAGIWALLPSSGGGGWFGTVAGILTLVAEICWFKMLRGLALEAREEGLYDQINLYLVSCVALVCGSCLFVPCSGTLLPALSPKSGGIGMLLILCLIPLLIGGLTAWYMIILYKVKACAVKLAKRARRAASRRGG
jgi:hypothetical protein